MDEVTGFWNIARAQPDEVAVVEHDTGRSRTRGEVAARTHRIVHALRDRGMAEGEVVAVMMGNRIEFLEVLLAALQAGWYVVPMNHHLTRDEIAHILGDSGARVLVVSDDVADIAATAADDVGLPAENRLVVGEAPGMAGFEDVLAAAPEHEPEGRSTGWFMTYTSGTTGRPKGIRRPLSGADPDEVGWAWSMQWVILGVDPRPPHVHLVQSPCYHTAVLVFVNASLQHGHRVVLMDRWTPEEALVAIERHGVTTTHMVPTHFHRLLRLDPEVRAAHDTSTLRYAIHGAAPCPVETKKAMIDWWGPVVYEYYGASEGGGTTVGPQDWLAHPGTVGRPWEGADVRILDSDGEPVPTGEQGEVWMKVGTLDFEYHNRPDQTAANKRDGYFTVGDLGHVDEEGYLYLHGRSSEVIITGGVNVHPSEVEAALLSHPDVADAAVFGEPDEEWGERIVAVVQPGPSAARDPLPEALVEHCRQHLAGYKVPRVLELIDELPRDPNGKLYKRRVQAERAARVGA